MLALDVPLAKAGVQLLEEGDLLHRQLDGLIGVLPLQRQPAFVPGAQPLVVEDLLHRDRRHPPAAWRDTAEPAAWSEPTIGADHVTPTA